VSLLSCSSTGALRLKLHGDCHECVAECTTLSTSRVHNDSQTKTRELVHFVALRSNWFYVIFEYITTYATTTSVFRGTTFGEAVALTTIFSHRLCTNVSWIAAKDRGGHWNPPQGLNSDNNHNLWIIPELLLWINGTW